MIITGKELLLISLNCILLFLVLSCQTKQEQNTTALPSSSDTVMHSSAPDTMPPPVLDTISIFEQILKNKRSSYHYKNDTIEIKYGRIINKKQNHLFIKLENVVGYRRHEFRIYHLLNNKFKLIFYDIEPYMCYEGYDLFDVNNDSYKDFLIAWHPANKSGQDCQDVYLYKKNKNEFSNSTSFCNSVFYPELKIVRGMFPGPVFFTFRWNKNYSVDTIEYIYGPYVCSPCIDSVHLHKVDYTKNKKITLLDEMPDYYDDDERDSIQQARFTY